mmetsp:Transcript_54804/g.111851  ORF Transcript_54804/g.111851 Transcript_54804/m.111851 type:complete len:158 (+) Transcript_54804:86-559(+)
MKLSSGDGLAFSCYHQVLIGTRFSHFFSEQRNVADLMNPLSHYQMQLRRWIKLAAATIAHIGRDDRIKKWGLSLLMACATASAFSRSSGTTVCRRKRIIGQEDREEGTAPFRVARVTSNHKHFLKVNWSGMLAEKVTDAMLGTVLTSRLAGIRESRS